MSKVKQRVLTVLCCISLVFGGMGLGVWITAEPLIARTANQLQAVMENNAKANSINTLSAEANPNNISADEKDSISGLPIETDNSETTELLANITDADIKKEVFTLPEIFLGANPAVVTISTESVVRNIWGQGFTVTSAGSGFIISADGYIVTNHHVIENTTRITVKLYDGTVYQTRVIGHNRANDIAVLKIEATDLPFLTFGDSDALMVGEQVAAIGNPLGELSNSMTVGYISGLNREINIDGIKLTMIQTDTAVNRGNSGGPLLNTKGQVVGIITAKSGGHNVEGLSFAIPSNTADEIVRRLIMEASALNQG